MLTLIMNAMAAVPVLVDSPEAGQAAAEVALREGLAPSDLFAQPLLALAPHGVPGARPCDGPRVGRVELRRLLDGVVAEYDDGHLAVAREGAAGLIDAAACLDEPVDPDWLWSAQFVSGLLAWTAGDRLGAHRAWISARGVDPARPWDENFAPRDALGMFAAAQSPAQIPFRGIGGPFLVDGRPATDAVAPGLRIVQGGDPLQTWVVDVHAAVTAIHPQLDEYTLPLADVAVILATELPDDPVAYLVRGSEVWRFDLRDGAVTVVPPRLQPRREVRWVRPVLAVGGGALVASGLVEGALAGRDANRAVQAGWEVRHDPADLAAQDARWRAAWWRVNAGVALGGVGVGLVVIAFQL